MVDRNYLLAWNELRNNNNKKFIGKKPSWFTRLKTEHLINNNNRKLINPLKVLPISRLTTDCYISPSPFKKRTLKTTVYFWSIPFNVVIYRKIIEYTLADDMVYMSH